MSGQEPEEARIEMQLQQGRGFRQSTRRAIATTLSLVAALLLGAAPASALPIEASVGTGPDLATLVVEFGDGADYAFEVFFDDTTITTGFDLMLTLEAELPGLSLTLVDFGVFGIFIDGIHYDGHSDTGFTGGEGYWHYWTKEAESDPWAYASVGAADRLMLDGGWDGWVYGTAAPPVPEPGTALLVGLGLVGLAGWRRTQSSR
jgi:hypothetical protein